MNMLQLIADVAMGLMGQASTQVGDASIAAHGWLSRWLPLADLAPPPPGEGGASPLEHLREGYIKTLSFWIKPLDAWLIGLPDWAGRASAAGLFIAAGIWVLTLKRDYIYRGAADQARWRDLRIWALVALLPYVVLYLAF
jgi:hypothetical protein